MDRNALTIQWLGHSCFKLTCGGSSLVIDPYDHVDGYPALAVEANEVICSQDVYKRQPHRR